jgi:small-conductance mechanosensitive channel
LENLNQEKDSICDALTEASFQIEELKAKEQVYRKQIHDNQEQSGMMNYHYIPIIIGASIRSLQDERDKLDFNLKETINRSEKEREDLSSKLDEKSALLDQTERSLLKV